MYYVRYLDYWSEKETFVTESFEYLHEAVECMNSLFYGPGVDSTLTNDDGNEVEFSANDLFCSKVDKARKATKQYNSLLPKNYYSYKLNSGHYKSIIITGIIDGSASKAKIIEERAFGMITHFCATVNKDGNVYKTIAAINGFDDAFP